MKNVIKVSLVLITVLLVGFSCQISRIEAVPVTANLRVIDGNIVKWNKKSVIDQRQRIQPSATRIIEGDIDHVAKK